MKIKTGRFGELVVNENERIEMAQGLLGFPDLTAFCLVDAGDDTLILWLQAMADPNICLPVLEPKIFKPDYTVRLSGAELRELKLDNINQAAVFSILTIPSDVTQMTANLKAPLVINLQQQVARQVVLQENEYNIRHEMFKELRAHLITIQSQKFSEEVSPEPVHSLVSIKNIPPSPSVRTLHN